MLRYHDTGVRGKTLRRRQPLGRATFGAPNQWQDRSFCCCIAGQGPTQKKCLFHRDRYPTRDAGHAAYKLRMYTPICISLYIYIHMYSICIIIISISIINITMYICIYIYIYIHRERERERERERDMPHDMQQSNAPRVEG